MLFRSGAGGEVVIERPDVKARFVFESQFDLTARPMRGNMNLAGKPCPLLRSAPRLTKFCGLPGHAVIGRIEARRRGIGDAQVANLHALARTFAHHDNFYDDSETGVQGRGVMIDLRRHLGDGRTLVGYDALMRIMDKDKVGVEPGDMVCLHTGFADMLHEMNREPDGDLLSRSCAVLEGRDTRLLQWITETGLVALIADN